MLSCCCDVIASGTPFATVIASGVQPFGLLRVNSTKQSAIRLDRLLRPSYLIPRNDVLHRTSFFKDTPLAPLFRGEANAHCLHPTSDSQLRSSDFRLLLPHHTHLRCIYQFTSISFKINKIQPFT